MTFDEVLRKLKSMANSKNVEGMARFGINPKNTLGVSIPNLRAIAKKVGKNHEMAKKLWQSGIHEARILAGMVDEVERVTERQMDEWVRDFDSWDVCDQVCMNLFDKTPFAFKKAIEYAKKDKEFEKRVGFALMSCLAWHDKTAADKEFIKFFPYIKRASVDERNYVKKAVNWSLRQIGKRNKFLNKETLRVAKAISKIGSKSAKWIAADATRELTKVKN